MNTELNREKLAEILFETFNVPAMATMSTAFLSLQTSGKETGVVIDMGGGGISIVPFHENSGFHRL